MAPVIPPRKLKAGMLCCRWGKYLIPCDHTKSSLMLGVWQPAKRYTLRKLDGTLVIITNPAGVVVSGECTVMVRGS